MAISISAAVPVAQVPSVQNTPKAQNQAAAVVAASTSTDTVKLTQNGQIHALKQQGQGVSQIANSLGVTVASVDSVLGIAVAAAPVAAIKTAGASASSTPEVAAAAAAPAAPVGVQAGPTPVAELNVAKG